MNVLEELTECFEESSASNFLGYIESKTTESDQNTKFNEILKTYATSKKKTSDFQDAVKL